MKVSPRRFNQVRFLERAVWVAAAAIIALSFLFLSRPIALGALVGALAAAINLTATRVLMIQLIRQQGRGRGLYLVSYFVRLSLLIALVAWAEYLTRLPPIGLALGFAALPLGALILAVSLIRGG